MDLSKAIIERCSVRDYQDKAISIETILEILNIAKNSPSSGNLQNWRFIIVTDESKRNEIAIACLNQVWMAKAPIHIIICNDYE